MPLPLLIRIALPWSRLPIVLSPALGLALAVAGCRTPDVATPTAPSASISAPTAATPASSSAPKAPVCGLINGNTCAPVDPGSFTPTVPPDICDPHFAGWVPNQPGFDQLSWSSFVALSWPADPSKGRGVPDTTKAPGAVGPEGNPIPAVWDTWKEISEVFHYDDPSWTLTEADWNKPLVPPPGCPTAPAGTPVLRMTAKALQGTTLALQGKLPNAVNQAFSGPLVDQAGNLVRYEIRMNQSEFDQIVDGSYYKATSPPPAGFKFWDNTTDPKFKLGSIEVKSAWRVLGDAEWTRHRYYQRLVLVYDEADPQRHIPSSCTLQKMGLVGLHLVHKTAFAPDWFWATFEHVDNVPETAGATGPFSFDNPSCKPQVTPAQCAAVKPETSDPQYQCCPNLERYKPIGPPPGDPYQMPRGPIQVTRVDPLSGASGCNTAYGAALKGTFWQNYILVGTQWLNQNSEVFPPVPPTITPATLRNSVIETYFTQWDAPSGNSPHQVVTSDCIGCHTGGTDFSYIFLAAKGNAALMKATSNAGATHP